MIVLREGFPVSVMNQVKAVPEVCAVFCATANPVEVLVAIAAPAAVSPELLTDCLRPAWRRTPTRQRGTVC